MILRYFVKMLKRNRESRAFNPTSGIRSCQNLASLTVFLGINGFITLFISHPTDFYSFIVKRLSHADPLYFCSPGAGSVDFINRAGVNLIWRLYLHLVGSKVFSLRLCPNMPIGPG